jgi:hypothetical protein
MASQRYYGRIVISASLWLWMVSTTEAFPTNYNHAPPRRPPQGASCFLSQDDDLCGEGFRKQTGPDGGDYCVFDYEAAAAQFGTDAEHLVPDADHYWEGLETQNKARQKFGLPPLTPEQYVALQAQNHALGVQVLEDATAAAFEQFDTNQDSVVSMRELRRGLEALLRQELTETSVQKVMDHFDVSGDGQLQPEEFVSLDQLKEKLRVVAQQEEQELAAQPQQPQQPSSSSSSKNYSPGLLQRFLDTLAFHLEDTCASNEDCQRPEVCCDFGFKKMCCRSGKMAHDLQLEYATVPVPQGYHY